VSSRGLIVRTKRTFRTSGKPAGGYIGLYGISRLQYDVPASLMRCKSLPLKGLRFFIPVSLPRYEPMFLRGIYESEMCTGLGWANRIEQASSKKTAF
jgi:hypothetical protein